MSALGPGGTLWSPMLWLLRLPVRSRIGGSRLTSSSSLSLVSGLLRYLVQGSLSLFGLLAGLMLLQWGGVGYISSRSYPCSEVCLRCEQRR